MPVCFHIPITLLFMLSCITRNSVIRRKLGTMPRLVDEINRVWDNALHSKDLVVLHTTSSFIMDKGMKVGLGRVKPHSQTCVRSLSGDGLKKKGSTIKSSDSRVFDPFDKNTLNQQLLVNSFDHHNLVLNKFPVVKNHVGRRGYNFIGRSVCLLRRSLRVSCFH